MLKKIALEEHFLSPGLIEYWMPAVAEMDRTAADVLFRRLNDFGNARLDDMARAGIERAVLSAAGPGVQAEPVVATAMRRASEANDFVAREVQKRPHAFAAFAHLPMQSPAAAAAELERCVNTLGFCGAFVHGQTHGRYLDEPDFDPFWERLEALDVPLYLHRAAPVVSAPALTGYPELQSPGWEAGMETASHVLRLVFGGVFDRHPRVRVILGRLGEGLPYLLSQFDAQAQREGIRLLRSPSDYFRHNIFVTTAGLLSAAPLYCAVAALGPSQIMFGTGHPLEPGADAGRFLDTVRLDEGLRAYIAFCIAEGVLGLN
jgi:2,3-dihydroxybenzoate decarboxylase